MPVIIITIIYFTANGFLPGGSGPTKTQNIRQQKTIRNNKTMRHNKTTHHTQNKTTHNITKPYNLKYITYFTSFITFLTFFLNVLGLQERVPKTSAGSWFQSWMVLH
jgi:hypothetical protein